MDTILITGADGFFASRFTEHYRDKYNIIALNHSMLDILDEKKTIETISSFNPTFVIHAAAISDTNVCEKNPELSYNVNVIGSINIAKGCAKSNSKLLYLSSDQVYNGNDEPGPYMETQIAVPNTAYGNHKIEAENAVGKIVQETIILRLTWLFSLPERNKKTNPNIVWNVLKAIIKNEPIRLPAHEYRGITYVYDLISNFEKMLCLPTGLYNAGSENKLSTYETGKSVLEKLGLSHRAEELLIKDEERYKDHNRDLRISSRKLSEFDIHFTSTEEAVSRCINEFSS